MSNTRKKNLLTTVTIKLGCISLCRRPKLSSIFSPKPKYHHQTHFNHHYSSTTTPFSSTTTPTTTTTTTTTSSSPFMEAATAVEKESSDPYLDFRASMLQMIVENEMYSKDDLRHLLTCFLHLNSPCLHGVIIKAFTEIWNSFFFTAADAAAASSSGYPRAAGRRRGGGGGRKESYGRPPRAYVRARSYEI